MATQYFTVPEKYAGYSLKDIHNDLLKSGVGTGLGSLGAASSFLGVGESQPLTAGQTLTANIPENYLGSSEALGIGKAFQTGQSPAQQLASTQAQQEADLMAKYQGQITGQEALPTAYERLTTQAGIPTLQTDIQKYKQQIYNVQSLLDKLEEDVTSRTKGTLTTEAQRNRQIAAEAAPLTSSLGRLATGLQPLTEQLSTASGNVATQLGLIGQQQQKELLPIQARIAAFSDQAAREISLYTFDKQSELDTLTAKLQQQSALSLAEYQRASDLLKQEKDYQNERNYLAYQYELKDKYKVSSGTTKSLSQIEEEG